MISFENFHSVDGVPIYPVSYTHLEMLLQKLELLCDLLGGKMSVSGSYPAWEFREDSPLRALIVEAVSYTHLDVYKRQIVSLPIKW